MVCLHHVKSQRVNAKRRGKLGKASTGFTLLELLVALTLAAAVIVLAVNLKQIAIKGAASVPLALRNWSVEQFMRSQVRMADSDLMALFELVEANPDHVAFISRRSAQFGEEAPVLVTYTFNATYRSIAYRELLLPPWWTEAARTSPDRVVLKRRLDDQVAWEGELLSGVDIAAFSYWDESRQAWTQQWDQPDRLPPLIELTISRLGQTKRIVLETEGLSFSLSSGP